MNTLPTLDELFYTIAGGDKFSKIDLKQAYLQMEVHPEDREKLSLNTHRGLYKCTRLLYGIASAPAIWQREIENILKYIPGVAVFLDDIKISGPTDQIHLQRLKQVLSRLSEYNVQINKDKCEFFKEGIHYCGHYIDRNGIHKEKAKIEAIKNMRRRTNTTELRAFLGNGKLLLLYKMRVQFCPLYKLLEGKQEKKSPFKWNTECEAAFQNAKKSVHERKDFSALQSEITANSSLRRQCVRSGSSTLTNTARQYRTSDPIRPTIAYTYTKKIFAD